MDQKRVIKIAAIFLLVFVCVNSALVWAQQDVSAETISVSRNGYDIKLNNLEKAANGFFIVTTVARCNSDLELGLLRAYPERPISQTFIHKFYDRNGLLAALFYDTISGLCSEHENYAQITGMSGYFTGEMAQYFSSSSSFNGSTGYSTVYFSGMPLTTITYVIHKNGTISLE